MLFTRRGEPKTERRKQEGDGSEGLSEAGRMRTVERAD